jgi:hypothetical protein
MELSIGQKAVRKMALLLLDDDNGIALNAYEFLSIMLVESGNEDIMEAVDVTENRAYVGEDYAEEELKKLEETDGLDGDGDGDGGDDENNQGTNTDGVKDSSTNS